MRRLIDLVLRAAELDQVLLAEGELAVELELLACARLLLRELGELLHVRVAGVGRQLVPEAAAAGQEDADRLVQEEERDAALGRARRSCAPA